MFEEVFNNALPLGFGMMRLPSVAGSDDIDIELTKKLVDTFIENGFTYFDTAWMYCGFKSENAVKEVLVNRYPRDAFTLATKLHSGFIKEKEDCDKVFNAQREKTGVDYFDYYLIHDINVHSIEVYDRLDVYSWIKDKKAKGLAKHIGFSFHDTPELLDKVLTEHPEFEFVQLQINYLDYESPAVQSRKCYEVAEKHNKPVIVMEPVKGGTLINIGPEAEAIYKKLNPEASVASYAIRFAKSHKNVRMVLSGMNSEAQVADNTSFMKEFKPLTEEERNAVNQVRAILASSSSIPCTGCSYCTDGCPSKIAIPKYFALYNADVKEDPEGKRGWTPQREYYDNVAKNFGKASDCIGCGQCEGICPQHLPVIKHLETVKARFE